MMLYEASTLKAADAEKVSRAPNMAKNVTTPANMGIAGTTETTKLLPIEQWHSLVRLIELHVRLFLSEMVWIH